MTPTTEPLSFLSLGTTATLVTTHPGARDEALAVLVAELDAIDLACSRFRPDSELAAVNRAAGRPVQVSALFLEAVGAALRAARLTSGAVDPTVGRALRSIGYDRDFSLVDTDGSRILFPLQPASGWQTVVVDEGASTVRVQRGVELDFGATAKALTADRAAHRAADTTGAGVLVSLGGDVAVAGPAPEGGWPIRVTHHHQDRLDAAGPVVAVMTGGLATSSTSVRRWQRGGRVLHHLVDPATGAPAVECWRTVSVAAGSCLDANIASCAAVIIGRDAPGWLEARGLPARLVDPAGRVTAVGGWPSEGQVLPC
jgi:thiamine biosynthesis lipoprotein